MHPQREHKKKKTVKLQRKKKKKEKRWKTNLFSALSNQRESSVIPRFIVALSFALSNRRISEIPSAETEKNKTIPSYDIGAIHLAVISRYSVTGVESIPREDSTSSSRLSILENFVGRGLPRETHH